ncbi:4'-phosphopantetheinyl transferase superfamily protein [Chryseobacterium sp. JJR-5R]|uniref:4'-phosphopantetheinyl transferase family protein n=1 Tax=Chryseobacterium sp. JJR-5R TaxID=3093923 RepID=UPI002A76338B|nr:4'-phosphopantetheinyl transferase superfamily protein [Chryseobacterium sp. JJR-5R]WPO84493.1 4'-phosphopantetheinyl transferase superfamily protein [Chryseobacterium sp. JJR-5R]
MLKILYSYLDKKHHPFFLNNYLLEMPLDFQEKVLKYKNWQDTQASIIGRLLLGILLKTFDLNLSIKHLAYNVNGKPYFEKEQVFFNISHSDDIVICVVTDINEIGIDIEKLQDININDFKNFLTKFEWDYINVSQNAISDFISLWTQKEAILKASGHGLSIDLNSFEINNDKAEINSNIYSLKEILINHKYKCHFAIKDDISQNTEIQLIKWFT